MRLICYMIAFICSGCERVLAWPAYFDLFRIANCNSTQFSCELSCNIKGIPSSLKDPTVCCGLHLGTKIGSGPFATPQTLALNFLGPLGPPCLRSLGVKHPWALHSKRLGLLWVGFSVQSGHNRLAFPTAFPGFAGSPRPRGSCQYVAHLQLLADDLEKHLDQVPPGLWSLNLALESMTLESRVYFFVGGGGHIHFSWTCLASLIKC